MSANPFIAAYIKELDRLYLTGLTTEHSFRPALQKLLENLCQCTVVNEQSHIDCGAPDLTLLRNNLPIAFVEAKNLEDDDLAHYTRIIRVLLETDRLMREIDKDE